MIGPTRFLSKLLVTLAACAVTSVLGGSASAASPEPLPIRIGWQPSGEFRFFIAKELNLFEQAGLKPTYIKFVSGPPTLAALKSGDIDVSFLGSAPAIGGIAQGIDYKIIMPANEGLALSALVARNDSGISSLKDIKGKKIASTKGASTYMAVLKALELQKLNLSDINFVDLAVPSMIPAFVHESVDAIWVWSPWSSKLVAENGKIIAGMRDVEIDWAQQLWVARTEWLKKDFEAAARLIKTMDLATKALNGNPAPAVQAVADTLAITPQMAREILDSDHYPTLEEMVSATYSSSLIGKAGYARGLEQQAEFMEKQNAINGTPNIAAAIDPGPVMDYLKTR